MIGLHYLEVVGCSKLSIQSSPPLRAGVRAIPPSAIRGESARVFADSTVRQRAGFSSLGKTRRSDALHSLRASSRLGGNERVTEGLIETGLNKEISEKIQVFLKNSFDPCRYI